MIATPPVRAGIYARQSQGNAKSIEDQDQENRSAADERGWQVAAAYADGKSAWRGRAARDDWECVLADIEDGRLDVLILWEPSRGDRDAERWLGLLRRCRMTRTLVHITSEENTYDVTKTRDWRHLAEQGLDSEVESDKTSKRVQRGQRSAAAAGRPSQGRTPFGYTRTRVVVPGEAGGKQRVEVHQHVDPVTAAIVREIFERLARNEAVGSICTDLNERGVPTLTARKWYRARVTDLAKNPAYIGLRQYNGQQTEGTWPPLVAAAVFHAVQRILAGPGHRRTSPGRQRHLLSYLATCGVCGADLCAVRGRYKCLQNGCITIVQKPTDELVVAHVLARLADPKVYEKIRRAEDKSDRATVEARNEVATLEARLKKWRQSAANDETTPESLAAIEAELTPQIEAAKRRTALASVPPALRAFLEPGADLKDRWESATLPGRREVLRFLAEVRVGRATAPGSRRFEAGRLGSSRWVGDELTWAQRWAR